MADLICMIVPLGRINVVGPCPSSIWVCPIIVVTMRWEGVIWLKYSLFHRMECEVPLSMMQQLGSSNGEGGAGWATRYTSGSIYGVAKNAPWVSYSMGVKLFLYSSTKCVGA